MIPVDFLTLQRCFLATRQFAKLYCSQWIKGKLGKVYRQTSPSLHGTIRLVSRFGFPGLVSCRNSRKKSMDFYGLPGTHSARMECLKLIASSKFAEKRVGGDPKRNPAPVHRWAKSHDFIGFLPSQVVQDFATIHRRCVFFRSRDLIWFNCRVVSSVLNLKVVFADAGTYTWYMVQGSKMRRRWEIPHSAENDWIGTTKVFCSKSD